MIKNILTVCVGNICRSPMAEALISERLPNSTVTSAGIGALVGHPADLTACGLMSARNLDLSNHRAQQISQELCKRADIILVMEESHRSYIHNNYAFTRGKVFRLAEHAKVDIPDPYRRNAEAFKHALELISEGVEVWCDRIAKL